MLAEYVLKGYYNPYFNLNLMYYGYIFAHHPSFKLIIVLVLAVSSSPAIRKETLRFKFITVDYVLLDKKRPSVSYIVAPMDSDEIRENVRREP